ncbi:MAG TPA: cell surface protein [Opitutaceae bacterium]|nr:cell surface protein [Opitutaceae bacterium]
MHNSRILHARRFFLSLGAALCLAFFSGCDEVKIIDLTPSSLAENPSQIYTLSLRATPKTSGFVAGSLVPRIIIDGKNFTMKPSAIAPDIYEFDYQLPAGRTELAYYFLVNFQVETNGIATSREAYTPVRKLNIVGRYVLSLEVNRGPVGARISVLGRGFTPQDVVYFDNTPARTVFESANALGVFVPAVEPNRNYRVTLGSSSGTSPVGTFRVDGGTVSVFPSSLSLRSGQTQTLTFTVPNPAQAGGLLLDLTTDIPESVIMPEVLIPAGQTTVTVNVQGGRPGSGSLFLKGYSDSELVVPVSVQ